VPDHPFLPAGFNADDNNGDEVDGAGTNWHVWPVLFDSFEKRRVLIITDEMLAVFDEACADYTPSPVDNTHVYPPTERVIEILSRGWRTIDVTSDANVVVIRASPRTKVVARDWDSETLPARNDIVLPAGSPNVVQSRKHQ
jgi:hypothetical protein